MRCSSDPWTWGSAPTLTTARVFWRKVARVPSPDGVQNAQRADKVARCAEETPPRLEARKGRNAGRAESEGTATGVSGDVLSATGSRKSWQRYGKSMRRIVFIYFVLVFSGPHLQHPEVPRLGVESESQLPASTTATATRDLSHIQNLHHSSWQRHILNPLNEARDPTCVRMDTGQVCYC